MRSALWLIALSACSAGVHPPTAGASRPQEVQPEPAAVEYGDPSASAIERYRPPHLAATLAIIEGTVNDTTTNARVAGTVISAVRAEDPEHAHQTVSDEHGRFVFDGVAPGTYVVSAYYSITGRGQFEVRRSEIDVAGAEAVNVPLWIEMVR
jgi:hypothetical protein